MSQLDLNTYLPQTFWISGLFLLIYFFFFIGGLSNFTKLFKSRKKLVKFLRNFSILKNCNLFFYEKHFFNVFKKLFKNYTITGQYRNYYLENLYFRLSKFFQKRII